MPSVYIIDDTAPNAFATGRDPEHASVAITTGLLQKLDREELQGVHRPRAVARAQLRHPLHAARRRAGGQHRAAGGLLPALHVLGRHVAAAAAATATPTAVARRRSSWSIALILAVLAPIFATLVQLAVSRQREYLADASSVELTRNPVRPGAGAGEDRRGPRAAGGRQPRHAAPLHRQSDQEAGRAVVGPVLDPPTDPRPHQPPAPDDRRGPHRPGGGPGADRTRLTDRPPATRIVGRRSLVVE